MAFFAWQTWIWERLRLRDAARPGARLTRSRAAGLDPLAAGRSGPGKAADACDRPPVLVAAGMAQGPRNLRFEVRGGQGNGPDAHVPRGKRRRGGRDLRV